MWASDIWYRHCIKIQEMPLSSVYNLNDHNPHLKSNLEDIELLHEMIVISSPVGIIFIDKKSTLCYSFHHYTYVVLQRRFHNIN